MNVATLPEIDFCVVDTETTGGKAETNKIIDIAAFHVRDGIVLDKFQTLINPGVSIPPWISGLTGIDNEMVKHAPRFSAIAEPLLRFLNKGIFVAHNAGFDFSFVRTEFARVGVSFSNPTLCTVKLARQLYPELPSRSLGALCEHLLISIFDRHRAAGDAEATIYVLKHLLKKLEKEQGVLSWNDLEVWLQTGPLELPEGVTPSDLARLPEEGGTYLFKDRSGALVFKGRCNNIRRRVRSYFNRSNQSEKSKRFRDVVRSIEAFVPASEVIAQS